MYLLIDGQALQSPMSRNRGIERFTLNLLAAVTAARPAWNIELIESEHLIPMGRARASGLPVRSFRSPLSFTADHRDVNECYFADWLTARGADVLLFPSFFDDHTHIPHFTDPRPRCFAILYDFIPLLFPGHYLVENWKRELYGARLRRLLAADGVLTLSQATTQDFRNLGGAPVPPITMIGGAPDPRLEPLGDPILEQERRRLGEKFGLQKPFILYVAGHDFRKNVPGALCSYAALSEATRREFDFLIVCRLTAEWRADCERLANRLGIFDAVRFTGYVSDQQLRALYQLCRLFFFPSLYEGLGLPILEAMRLGAPVVASNRSSMPEAAGPLSWLADPASPRQLAAALETALAEPYEARRRPRMEYAQQFTWERTAERACRALEMPASAAVSSRRKRRLAWVSPFPPSWSGIADYSAKLIAPLSEYYDIDLVLDPRAPLVTPELAQRHTVLLANEFTCRHDAWHYDALIYQIGNSHYHTFMLDLLRRFRSLVVLHDYSLGGLMLSAIEDGLWPTSLVEELEAEGHGQLAKAVAAGIIRESVAAARVPLNRRILTAAGAVLVHSTWTWERVRRSVSVPVACVRQVAPLPRLGSRVEERQRLGIPGGWFVIASIGSIHPAKRIDSLLRAISTLPEAMRIATQVLIVGYAPAGHKASLESLAHELGIKKLVRFTDRVPADDLPRYARAADVCVQLRYPTAGETSAALLGNLAAGAACIISAGGAMAELPEDVVLRVRSPDYEVADLTAALQRLYENPWLRERLGEAAQRHVRRFHSLEQITPRYAAMIELVIAQRERGSAPWVERACNALGGCPDAGRPLQLIESWAKLRWQGQQLLAKEHKAPTISLPDGYTL
jgi:glycosyltransferase involved in cell wall biosynthesis